MAQLLTSLSFNFSLQWVPLTGDAVFVTGLSFTAGITPWLLHTCVCVTDRLSSLRLAELEAR